MKPYKGQIDKWHLVIFYDKLVVVGVKMGREDNFIRTSPIVVLTPNTLETMNSIYTLGEPFFAS